MSEGDKFRLKAVEMWESGDFDESLITQVLGYRIGIEDPAQLLAWFSSIGAEKGSRSKAKKLEARVKAAELWTAGICTAAQIMETYGDQIGLASKASLLIWLRNNGYTKKAPIDSEALRRREKAREEAIVLRRDKGYSVEYVFELLASDLGFKNSRSLRYWFTKNGINTRFGRTEKYNIKPKSNAMTKAESLKKQRAIKSEKRIADLKRLVALWETGDYNGKQIRHELGEDFPFSSLGGMYVYLSKNGVKKGEKKSD
ncbi:TPA: hypothetical protein ACTYZB_004863 [Klebsiella variicola]